MVFVKQIYRILKKEFPNLQPPLHYNAPHELAIAVILSAQCTDEQVNRVTPKLFSRFRTPLSLANAPLLEIEKVIYSTGFYKNKTKNIRGFCKILLEDHNGKIPQDISSLVRMPGVGRKTANVILQVLYNIPSGIVVDTHVLRTSRLLGLTKYKDAHKVEQDLIKKLPQSFWIDWSLLMIFHGRKYCKARKPNCEDCPLESLCPSSEKKYHRVKNKKV